MRAPSAPTLAAACAIIVASIGLAGCAAPLRISVGSLVNGKIVAPPGGWTWIPLPETHCGNGLSTGMAIEFAPNQAGASTQSAPVRDLVLYFAGGGACWDAHSCFGAFPAARFFVHGYGLDDTSSDANFRSVLLSRGPDALFPDANFVYVPYCTGDLHVGDHVVDYSLGAHTHRAYHVGARNVDVILAAIGPTLTTAPRIFLVGGSAGGFGALFNHGRVKAAAPHARIFVIDDSGPPVNPTPERFASWMGAWRPQAPLDCAECAARLDAWVDHFATRFPDDRFALLSHDHDATYSFYAGLSGRDLSFALAALATRFATTPNQRVFSLPGIGHVVLSTPSARADGLTAVEWLRKMITGAPDW